MEIESRGHRMKPVTKTAIVLVFQFFLVWGVIFTGIINVAATARWWKGVERFLGYVSARSINYHAPKRSNPFLHDKKAIEEGLHQYAAMCLLCHGAPGIKPSELGSGLSPTPPDLTSKRTQSFTNGELHWIISQGIRMTGMPAFGPTHDEDTLWKITAFVRHLPQLTEEETMLLRRHAAPLHRLKGLPGND